jgi:hypothetical protein
MCVYLDIYLTRGCGALYTFASCACTVTVLGQKSDEDLRRRFCPSGLRRGESGSGSQPVATVVSAVH